MADMSVSAGVKRVRPKYQVFISSTIKDLSEIRQAVTWEILAAGHIPAGMENFPATHDRGWQVIQRTIDKSDYYVIIVAGLYGTVDPTTGKSWTQREYEYALERGVPVLAFIRELRSIVAPEMERDEQSREKLDAFINVLQNTHLKKSWFTKDDLATKVVQAVNAHIANDEDDDRARPGWFRGDQIPTAASMNEFARLSAENAQLKTLLADLSIAEKESLVVLDRDGSPLTDSLWDFCPIEVTDLGQNTYASITGSFLGANAENTAELADSRAKTYWLTLSLHNTGRKVARGVVVDVVVDGTSEIMLHRFNYQGKHVEDPQEHCYVEYSRQDGRQSSVRQRVRQIGIGHADDLVRLGFVFENVTRPLSIACTARSEDGVSWEGSWKVQARKRPPRQMTERELSEM